MTKSIEELFDDSSSAHDSPALGEQAAAPPSGESVQRQEPPAPEAQAAPEVALAATEEKPASQDKGAPPAPEDNDGRDPAFGRIRKERNDYREQLNAEKVERARIEERLAAREKAFAELEARQAQVQPAQQPQPQAPQIPNPIEDPKGFLAYQQQVLFNERLNISEAMLREQVGDEDVDAKIALFKQAAAANPLLVQQLHSQAHPFKWAYDQAKRIEASKEIGNDPNAYRARVEAELREKIEAEIRAQLAPETAPETRRNAAPNLPPSLGRVPNAGARGASYTGPAPIEALWDS